MVRETTTAISAEAISSTSPNANPNANGEHFSTSLPPPLSTNAPHSTDINVHTTTREAENFSQNPCPNSAHPPRLSINTIHASAMPTPEGSPVLGHIVYPGYYGYGMPPNHGDVYAVPPPTPPGGSPVGTPVMGVPYAVQPGPVYGQPVHSQPRGNSDLMSALVFIAGCFCCPIWCLGWMFIRKTQGAARTFGILSVVAAFVTSAAIILIVVLVMTVGGNCNQQSADKCARQVGCGWCTSSMKCTRYNGCASGSWLTSLDSICNEYEDSPNTCRRVGGCVYCGDDCEPMTEMTDDADGDTRCS